MNDKKDKLSEELSKGSVVTKLAKNKKARVEEKDLI